MADVNGAMKKLRKAMDFEADATRMLPGSC